MKKYVPILFVLFVLSSGLFAVDITALKTDTDYMEQLLANEVFMRYIVDADYSDGSLFFLESKLSMVFRVDFKSAKLIRTYFRRGQGPKELAQPIKLEVKNGKIFVLDRGFSGVKVVDLEGNAVNEFKLSGYTGDRNIAVNNKDEIFVGEYDGQGKTFVSVYNLKGVRIRTLAKNEKEEDALPLNKRPYLIRLDTDGNVYILFNLLRELKKFNSKGELLWQANISNDILNSFLKKDIAGRKKDGTVRMKYCVFNLNLTPNNNIIVGHCGGGSLFEGNGTLKKIITADGNHSLDTFIQIDSKIINILALGKLINIYNLKEDLQ